MSEPLKTVVSGVCLLFSFIFSAISSFADVRWYDFLHPEVFAMVLGSAMSDYFFKFWTAGIASVGLLFTYWIHKDKIKPELVNLVNVYRSIRTKIIREFRKNRKKS